MASVTDLARISREVAAKTVGKPYSDGLSETMRHMVEQHERTQKMLAPLFEAQRTWEAAGLGRSLAKFAQLADDLKSGNGWTNHLPRLPAHWAGMQSAEDAIAAMCSAPYWKEMADAGRRLESMQAEMGLNVSHLLEKYGTPDFDSPQRVFGMALAEKMVGTLGSLRVLGLPSDMSKIAEEFVRPLLGIDSASMQAFLERTQTAAEILGRSVPEGFAYEDEEESQDREESKEREGAASVVLCPFPPDVLADLRMDPSRMRYLTAGMFQDLIANRLERMGFRPIITGNVYAKDGGIDIIAIPERVPMFGALIAVQCEHHAGPDKTGRRKGRDLLEWRHSRFHLGVLVTNTDFTADMRFAAAQTHNRDFLRLRNFGHLARWIVDRYEAAFDADELPTEIELAPGIIVKIPKPLPPGVR